MTDALSRLLAECMVGFVLGLNCFVHLVRYTWIRFYQQPVHVNSKQKKLFRILDTGDLIYWYFCKRNLLLWFDGWLC